MECRKMVLMNLFVGQQWKRIHREQTLDGNGDTAMVTLQDILVGLMINQDFIF